MSLVAETANALRIRAETTTGTIVVQTDGPVDKRTLARIRLALRPLLAAQSARVEVDFAGARQVLDVA